MSMSHALYRAALRSLTIGSATLFALSGCPTPAAEPQRGTAPAVPDPKADVDMKQTEVDADGIKFLITLKDGAMMQAALLQALRQSDLTDRELLIKSVENSAVVINDAGGLRIGAWHLVAQGAGLQLTYRASAGPGMAFTADVTRAAEGWQVHDLQTLHIHPRR
jgi:hypothetical protein